MQPLTAQEVGDGNLNLVFFVENADDPTNSIVVKQALPYLRVMGESWPLTRERVRYETQALRKHNEVAPGLAPEVYDYNEEMSTLAMEHLRDHDIMRKPLVARQRFPLFADHHKHLLGQLPLLHVGPLSDGCGEKVVAGTVHQRAAARTTRKCGLYRAIH